ncbi:MAG: hypothetical protein U5O16_23410, partial [Rhodococcus sp. (in: high G+C Gram-positive bacteria)]|uniref:hypothetical protein n=1 Tax=Rhodococcus sp. TaxID=1831 RepID=UPI002AD68D46|nr:hypothetical protein [Rhodococcus sp. (in: high G+C Gram-positive bacteria)]
TLTPVIPTRMAGVFAYPGHDVDEVDAGCIANPCEFFHTEFDLSDESPRELLLCHAYGFGDYAL